jgi:AraC-like DNA-binding protein
LRAACEQMLEPEIPIAEISLALGFADQSHFTRSFHRFVGVTPAAFRLQITGHRPHTPGLRCRQNLTLMASANNQPLRRLSVAGTGSS